MCVRAGVLVCVCKSVRAFVWEWGQKVKSAATTFRNMRNRQEMLLRPVGIEALTLYRGLRIHYMKEV